MIDLAFYQLGLDRVALAVFEFNPRAIRSYEKAGFRMEGRLRDTILRDGRHWDGTSTRTHEAHRASSAAEVGAGRSPRRPACPPTRPAHPALPGRGAGFEQGALPRDRSPG